jgi:competence protein ComEA
MLVSFLAYVLRTRFHEGEAVRMVQSDTGRTMGPSPARLDLNRACEEDLQLLPGVGAQRAHQVVLFRMRRGSFSSIDQLAEVPGFSRALVDRLAPMLTVNQPFDPVTP